MKRSMICLALVLVLVFCAMPVRGEAETLGWDGWTPVSSQAELQAIGASSESLMGKYYLTNDITLTGEWTPIGLDTGGFGGILDGNGHTISNVTITSPTKGMAGLFHYLTSGYSYPNYYKGVVRNLKVEVNYNMTLGSYSYIPCVGGIASSNMGGLVYNCDVSGTMNVKSDSGVYLGGLVGDSSGTITDCNSSVAITHASVDKTTESMKYIGGIVGHGSGNFTACGNTGDITADAQFVYLGGILGYSSATGDIVDCCNTGNLTVTNQISDELYGENNIGGILGYVYSDLTVKRCFNTGEITSNGNYWNYAGGIIGMNQQLADLVQCFNTGSVRAVSYATTTGGDPYAAIGGLMGCGSDCTVTDSYNLGTVGAAAYSNLSSYRFPCPYIGGLVGQASNMSFTRCFNKGACGMSPACSNYWIGGIVGIDNGRDEADECVYTNTYWLYGYPYMVGIDQKPSWSTANTTGQLSTSTFKTQSKFVNFDFTNTWVMGSSNPELRMDAEVPHVHSYETLTTRAATCTQKGLADGWYCSGCGLYFAEKETRAIDSEERWIPMLDHTPGEAVIENEVQGADCQIPGTAESVVYCTVCDAEISRTEVEGPVGSHSDGDYVIGEILEHGYWRIFPCTICGEEMDSVFVECTDADTWDGSAAADSFAGGAGTEEDPYLIENADQWQYFAQLPSEENSNLSGVHVRLLRDLDMNGSEMSAVATFAGHFDGGGNTIRGVNISEDSANAGLFFKLQSGAVVENITVCGSVSSSYIAAGIAGSATDATIRGCVNETTVTGGTRAGGILGYAVASGEDVIIENCVNYGSVTAPKAGGILGASAAPSAESKMKVIVRLCVNVGAITGTEGNDNSSNTDEAAGGIVGYQWNGSVERCMNMGPVTGVAHVGGITGEARGEYDWVYNYRVSITDCCNSGTVSGDTRVGGVVGYVNILGNTSGMPKGTLARCYNVGAVTGDTSVGNVFAMTFNLETNLTKENNYAMSGVVTSTLSPVDQYKVTVKSDFILRQQESFEGFDFEGVWQMGKPEDNYPYPVLRDLPGGMIIGGACGGEYGEPEVIWKSTDSGYTVTVTLRCTCGNENHVASKNLIATPQTTPATCTEPGVTVYTVTAVFGAETYTDSRTVEIPAAGHTSGEAVVENEKPGDCQTQGSYDIVNHCTLCGEEVSRETVNTGYGDHGEEEILEENYVDGTCEVEGSYEKVTNCALCGEELSRETVSTGYADHTPGDAVRENETPGDCQTQGSYERVISCTVCSEELSRETVTAGYGDHHAGEPVREEGIPGDCQTEGEYYNVYYCTLCGDEVSCIVVNTGLGDHSLGAPVVENEVPGKDCRTPGSYETVSYCTLCGEGVGRQTHVGSPGPHVPGEPVRESEQAPGCEDQGSYVEVTCCALCDEELSRTVAYEDPTGHTPGEAVWENETLGDCQTKGTHEEAVYCLDCGTELSRTTVTDGFGSHVQELIPGVAPGCETPGRTDSVVCSLCGWVIVESVPIGVRGHSYGDWQVARPAGYYTPGEEVRVCHCGAEESRSLGRLPNPFVDVAEGEYYCEPVLWAAERGITMGTTANTFGPEETCTRAQVVTFLWRAQGQPEPKSGVCPFDDVKPEDYFYKAVLWAVENGITAGTDPGKFSPEDPCTRAQVATFLWRAQGQPEPKSLVCGFSDVATGEYYFDAVLWAVENGITQGTGDGKFSPDESCTRAQIVTFLFRFANQ